MVRVFPDVRYPITPTPPADPRILQDFGTLLQDFVPRVDDLCRALFSESVVKNQMYIAADKEYQTGQNHLPVRLC